MRCIWEDGCFSGDRGLGFIEGKCSYFLGGAREFDSSFGRGISGFVGSDIINVTGYIFIDGDYWLISLVGI